MDFFKRAPDFIRNLVPAGMHGLLEGVGWWIILGVAGLLLLVILFILFKVMSRMFSGSGERKTGKLTADSSLEENLAEYPKPKPSTGDRQLRVEGVPVRMRLLAMAPAGHSDEIDEDEIPKMLNRVAAGLGDVFLADKPRVRIWPVQISYEGFAKHFHRNTLLPEGEDAEGEETPWVIVAGRVKLGKQQIMLGMALLAAKPTTVGRRTYDTHEWTTAVKVRVREG